MLIIAKILVSIFFRYWPSLYPICSYCKITWSCINYFVYHRNRKNSWAKLVRNFIGFSNYTFPVAFDNSFNLWQRSSSYDHKEFPPWTRFPCDLCRFRKYSLSYLWSWNRYSAIVHCCHSVSNGFVFFSERDKKKKLSP